MKQINKLKSLILGETPIYQLNDGKPIDQVVIRHKDLFFIIDIDTASGEPTGGFGWSQGEAMTHVPVREQYTAVLNTEIK